MATYPDISTTIDLFEVIIYAAEEFNDEADSESSQDADGTSPSGDDAKNESSTDDEEDAKGDEDSITDDIDLNSSNVRSGNTTS